MPIGRLALPAATGGLAAGILVADLAGPITAPGLAVLGCVAGAAIVVSAAFGGDRARAGMVLVVVAGLALVVGSWRQAAAETPPAEGASVASLVDGAEHELVGTVVDDPRPRADRLQLVLGELHVARDGSAVALEDRLLVRLPRGIAVESGDRLRLTTRVELPEDFDGFAYREYLARQGIGGIGEAQSAERVGRTDGPAAWLASIRNALLDGLNRVVPEPEAALGAGILLGVRSAIAPDINEAFARAGLTHVVAISGWNIAIVAALVAAAARPVERRGGRWSAALIVTATVAGYVVLTGATPSVVRAALMAGALLVGRLGGSRAHAGSALALAALVMLLVAPSLLWDVGFQLSLLATGGLIWFGGPIERRLAGWPGLIREPVALTLAAQVTTLPVILVNFERLSLVAPVANVLVVPFVPLAMLFSAAGRGGGGGRRGAAAARRLRCRGVAGGRRGVAGAADDRGARERGRVGAARRGRRHAPGASCRRMAAHRRARGMGAGCRSGPPPDPRAAARAGADGRVLRLARRVARPLPLAAALLVILGAISLASLPDGRLHLTVLDVGQGDGILIETPTGATMLVDGGPDPELTLGRLGANLAFFDRRIDLVLLSHPHQDHVAGLVDVLDRFRIGTLLHGGIHFDNQAYDQLLADAAEDPMLRVDLARAGQVFRLDEETTVEVLYPSAADAANPLPHGDINNGSVVVLLRHGEFEALLTGDAEAPIEETLLRRGLVPRVEVLKVGHHGSASSSTPAFLEAARPGVAVISSGVDNEYGHPAFETLRALGAVAGLTLHRTDLDGDVEIVSDGRSYRVHTAAAGWTEPRALAGAGPALADAGSIGACQSPTVPRLVASSTTQSCPTASWFIPREWRASPPRPPDFWRRRRSRSTAPSSRRRRCSTTSTSSRFGAPAASTGSSGRDGSRPRAIRSSRCRSPPTRSAACSTTIASRAAGRRWWWPLPIDTSRRLS